MADPREVRQQIREGKWRRPTAGLAPGFVQANLVILPRDLAFDFLLFRPAKPEAVPGDRGDGRRARRSRSSPRPAPICAPMFPGTASTGTARSADEVTDLRSVWRDDLVSFLLGCSFTFESALLQAGVPVRHIEEGRNVPMFITNIPCAPAGVFRGPLVVTMRPIPAAAGGAGGADHRAVSGRPRGARAHRRPGGHRHPRPRAPGLRRRRDDPTPGRCRCSGPAA